MITSRAHRGLCGAAALGLALTGCHPAPPEPSGPSTFPPCTDSTGRLIADVNNDDRLDRVTGTEGTGADLAVSFGDESGFSEPRTPKDLLGSSPADLLGELPTEDEQVVAAVADFDGDGWLDLVVAAATPTDVDDAGEDPRVGELRLGPFSDRGIGQRTVQPHLGYTYGLRVVDLNEDEHPDLASYYHYGDGHDAIAGLLGGAENGLSGRDGRFHEDFTASQQREAGGMDNLLPPAASDRFLPACDA
ncbi:FG-GAP repeat domain-containing protein [Nocardiopsis quinghaiensis]|uniref:FG-GAP repeat domain-containing protein n=1 Tax=Nocardiopsis quinghaiensis TaxID=464995 RepID=UPI001681181B|nr:VCBS repeat-containing protein [Nocardiopsis quinghaiensis]